MVCIEYREGSMFYKETAELIYLCVEVKVVEPIINILVFHGWARIRNTIQQKFLNF